MKKFRYIAVIVSAVLLSVCAFAKDTLSPKDVFTYDGKSLAEFAGVDEVPEIAGYSAYAINLNTGSLIFQKNGNDKVFPASTVKLMTAIVAYENIPDLSVDITVSREAEKKTQGSNVNMKQGEIYSAEELLHALLISGANDAAYVLAEYVSGSEDEFVSLMNRKAKEIGAADTFYANVTGFHDERQVTTAADTAKIAQYFYYKSDLFEISNKKNYSESERLKRILTNRNALISKASTDRYIYRNAGGMSYGSTPEGGYCIVSTVADENNLVYLCVVMNSKDDGTTNYAYTDIRSLFDFCTDNFGYHIVSSTDTVMCELPVENAVDIDHFALFPDAQLKVLLPNNLDYAKEIAFEKRIFTEEAEAPVNKGAVFGEVVIKYKGEVTLGRCNLVSDVSIDKSNLLYFFSEVEEFITSTWFVVFVATAILLFGIYLGLSIYYKYFRKSKYTGVPLAGYAKKNKHSGTKRTEAIRKSADPKTAKNPIHRNEDNSQQNKE